MRAGRWQHGSNQRPGDVMWIELHDTARDHPKILKIARDLGITPVHALGHVVSLWTWTLRMAPDGCLASFDGDDIELAAQWDGKPGAFIASCTNRNLLDDKAGVMSIHDWMEFAGSLKAARRAKASRERKCAEQCELSNDVRRRAQTCVTIQNSAQTDQTDQTHQTRPTRPDRQSYVPERSHQPTRLPKPSTNLPPLPSAVGGDVVHARVNGSESIHQVFSHYRQHHPRRHLKPSTKMLEWKKVKQRLDEGFTAEDLCKAIDGNHLSPWHCGQNDQGKEFHDLELIVRDSAKVNTFMAIADNPPSQNKGKTSQSKFRSSLERAMEEARDEDEQTRIHSGNVQAARMLPERSQG